jgi:hypothetical protein
MKPAKTKMALAALLLPVLITIGSGFAAPATVPDNFADAAFKNVWTRTDSLVDSGSVKRSYFWGPVPGFTAYEEYAEGDHGKHLVQYFDKSRMEINNPSGDKSNPFYVTNGLLTEELITGRMQTGTTRYEQRYPAEIDIASDGNDTAAGTPTYASFTAIANIPVPDATGETIDATIDRAGNTPIDATFTNYNVRYAHYEPATHHNIPDIFWQFLNQSGPVVQNGKTVNARLSDPYFYATGYPIADAYWARVTIAGIANTAVLVQPYERRVLTYVPDAPEGFKVQMGNIGQHYYAWRYSDAGKPTGLPTSTPYPTVTVGPTATPVPCALLPLRGFGKVWADNPVLRTELGCTGQDERSITTVQQSFQEGQMLETIGNYGHPSNKIIYVLFGGGDVLQYADTFVDGSPDPTTQPPPGLYAPVRGLGKVWREQTASRVRERLGWATGPEVDAISQAYPIASLPTPVPGQGAAVQNFPRGLMVYAGPQLKKIYAIYNDQTYLSSQVNRWSAYDDTYQEP